MPLALASGPNTYQTMLLIPAGTFQPRACAAPYKLVMVVAYRTPLGRPGPIAGFVEEPIVNFYAVFTIP